MDLDTLSKHVYVPTGKDRFEENNLMIWGMIPLASKVSAEDTGGALYVFEHANMGNGGPPRHLHHEQDEWFYVIKGDFVFEVGGELFRLKPGDSLFGPRNVPHTFSHVGDTPGTLLAAISPAGSFETFIREAARLETLPTPTEMEKAFAAHGMKIVGPPLNVAE
jgi:mannose-6-phosphate isomerase-like protein (cupin superfamily)